MPFRNSNTQPVQLIELEMKYLRQTINVLRNELEKSKISEEEKVQAVKKTLNNELNQHKDTINNLRSLMIVGLISIASLDQSDNSL